MQYACKYIEKNSYSINNDTEIHYLAKIYIVYKCEINNWPWLKTLISGLKLCLI